MLARVTHILPLTNIRRERLLPLTGRVITRIGQKVSSTDVIADARMATQHMLLDISRGLGLPPSKVDRLIQRKVGDRVVKGDILANRPGVFPRIIRATQDGRIAVVGGGQMMIELDPDSRIELRAGMAGTVLELIADRGAIIENNGALIQGVWGNDRIDEGLLTVLAKNPQDELTPDQIDVSMRGAVVLGGICTRREVLRTAAEIPLRALVLGSLATDLLPEALALNIPILVLEGFGKLPISSLSFNILSTNDKRGICVNAAIWNQQTGIRPELVIPLPTSGMTTQPVEISQFTAGRTVRIVHPPFKGMMAKFVSLRPGLTSLPNGIRTQAAVLRMENNEQAVIPLANLEVIE